MHTSAQASQIRKAPKAAANSEQAIIPLTGKVGLLAHNSRRVTVEDIEVTQSVQNLKHDVPIIAGKTTVVRVYLSYDSEGCLPIKGELSLTLPSGSVKTFTSFAGVELNPAMNGDIQGKREDERASLNFRLPPGEISLPADQDEGILHARLVSVTYDPLVPTTCSRLDPAPTEPLICANCAEQVRSAKVTGSPSFTVRLIGLDYRMFDYPSLHSPSERDVSLLQSWLRRVYPVAESQLIFEPRYRSQEVSINFNHKQPCNEANAIVAELRGREISDGLASSTTHYYGLVSDSGRFMEGCSSIIPGAIMIPPAVASGPVGRPEQYDPYLWDTDGSYGDFYAGHELAHTMGRKHPGFCFNVPQDDPDFQFKEAGGHLTTAEGGYVGFDVGDYKISPVLPMKALPGSQWTELMTYCPNRWISSYTYLAILQWLRAEGHAVTPQSPTPFIKLFGSLKSIAAVASADESRGRDEEQDKGLQNGDFIHLVATVDLTIPNARITSARRTSISTGATAVPERRGLQGKIRLRGRDDKTIVEYLVFIRETQVETNMEQGKAKDVSEKSPPVNEPAEDGANNRPRVGLIDAVIPYHVGTSKIELVLFKNTDSGEIETVADTYVVNKTPPRIKNVRTLNLELFKTKLGVGITGVRPSPAAGAEVPLSITWAAATGPNITYSVEISTDKDVRWKPIAVGLTTTRYNISPDDIAKGATKVRIKVVVSDGFNKSVVLTKYLTLTVER
jgi:hypothetical protein